MTQYHKMDSLRACITEKNIYLYIEGQKPKQCSIVSNKMHYDILIKCPQISKEEFENNISTRTSEESLFKALYLADINKQM